MRETARRVSCSAGYLSNVLHGRKRPSARVAARLDDLLEAGGGLAALSGAAELVTRAGAPSARQNPRSQARDKSAATTEGMSLSLPYVPGRLVIEISDPAVNAGQVAAGPDYPEPVTGQLAVVQGSPRQGQRGGRG